MKTWQIISRDEGPAATIATKDGDTTTAALRAALAKADGKVTP